MVPLKIVWRDPEGLGTADSAGVCRCDDSCEYVLKDGRENALVPHSEWLCTKLAESVGIACPPCAIIETDDGVFAFGSRWEGGLARDPWYEMLRRKELDQEILSPTLSKIFAFDHFIHNDDRHLNNYLVRETRNGWTMLALDFSRSWATHGIPPPNLPLPEGSNTRRAAVWLKKLIGDYIDVGAALGVLDKLHTVSAQEIEGIIRQHPPNWLVAADEAAIMEWWKSDGRSDRLQTIREGMRRGTYV